VVNSESGEFHKEKWRFTNQKMCKLELEKAGKRALSACKVETLTICSEEKGAVEPQF